ncbi:conserved hypothetical protein [Pediculus humanus corporis]|uniref:Uncharacterized protein n=1 Tax=Pediculus humanus subsp. corporis TaxID=121224 RepID=E0VK47_PEDHC|nr:uncharacterized protein Phum_PHUM256910 [Pediculus humanus corporis]EEB13753.1 conserved hypothetical protein [Pediculus humanus corporis]
MFGLILSGQLVQTDFQLVGKKQFLINVPNADNVNHIVVFLTGTMPFPEGCGGLVYFSFPDPNSPPCWHLLGFISNEKPSAIFRISNLKNTTKYALNADGSTFMFGQGEIRLTAQVGIAVENMANIQQQCINTPAENINASSFVEFSQKMLQNFMNYASSFIINQAQMVPNVTESYIPFSVLSNWYSNFERRLLQNPNFWKE